VLKGDDGSWDRSGGINGLCLLQSFHYLITSISGRILVDIASIRKFLYFTVTDRPFSTGKPNIKFVA
jgi:hypothetical protein